MQDLANYHNAMSRKNQLYRLIWNIVWAVFARPLPRSIGSTWKRFLLRLFGAKLAPTAVVYSSTRIYMPCHLEMDDHSCLANEVECYNVAPIKIGKNSTVSQRTFLCSASHDISRPDLPLVFAPITIGNGVWVAAEAFVGPGVTINDNSVIGARACVFRDVASGVVIGAVPGQVLKKRIFKEL